MMRYKISLSPGCDVTISLDASEPDTFAELVFEGHPEDIATVEELLFFSHGVDGRLIERKTTPVDLDVAIRGRWLRPHDPICVDGQAILDRYVRKISR